MTELRIIENKISQVREYLTIIERYQHYSRDEIEYNIDTRGMVERYLYLLTQSAVELAEAVVAYRKLRKPTSMSEAFDILFENDLIQDTLRQRLVEMTGFRNILAHEYRKINYDIVYRVLHDGKEDIKQFIEIVGE